MPCPRALACSATFLVATLVAPIARAQNLGPEPTPTGPVPEPMETWPAAPEPRLAPRYPEDGPSEGSSTPAPRDDSARRGPASPDPDDLPPGTKGPPTTDTSPAAFGDQGQVVLTGATDLGLSFQFFSSASDNRLNFWFSPTFDYFVAKNVSLGVEATFTYASSARQYASGSTDSERLTSTGISIGPRLGFNLRLRRNVSFFPVLGIAAGTVQRETELSGLAAPSSLRTSVDATYVDVRATAPFLFHVAPHFFVGFGPRIAREVYRSGGGSVSNPAKTTSLALAGTVGGWF